MCHQHRTCQSLRPCQNCHLTHSRPEVDGDGWMCFVGNTMQRRYTRQPRRKQTQTQCCPPRAPGTPSDSCRETPQVVHIRPSNVRKTPGLDSIGCWTPCACLLQRMTMPSRPWWTPQSSHCRGRVHILSVLEDSSSWCSSTAAQRVLRDSWRGRTHQTSKPAPIADPHTGDQSSSRKQTRMQARVPAWQQRPRQAAWVQCFVLCSFFFAGIFFLFFTKH